MLEKGGRILPITYQYLSNHNRQTLTLSKFKRLSAGIGPNLDIQWTVWYSLPRFYSRIPFEPWAKQNPSQVRSTDTSSRSPPSWRTKTDTLIASPTFSGCRTSPFSIPIRPEALGRCTQPEPPGWYALTRLSIWVLRSQATELMPSRGLSTSVGWGPSAGINSWENPTTRLLPGGKPTGSSWTPRVDVLAPFPLMSRAPSLSYPRIRNHERSDMRIGSGLNIWQRSIWYRVFFCQM